MTTIDRELQPEQSERKYVLDAATALAFWSVASERLHAQNKGNARPVMYVRTTYYDTFAYDYFRSARGPIARRLRVREYAHPNGRRAPAPVLEPCYLELKQSAAGLRSKSRVPMPLREVPRHLARLPDAPLRPCVCSRYRRSALVGGDSGGDLRVTLDDCISFCAPGPLGAPLDPGDPRDVLALGPPFVLEVKTWGAPPAWLAAALAELTEATEFSKFAAGMRAAVRGGLLVMPAASAGAGA